MRYDYDRATIRAMRRLRQRSDTFSLLDSSWRVSLESRGRVADVTRPLDFLFKTQRFVTQYTLHAAQLLILQSYMKKKINFFLFSFLFLIFFNVFYYKKR